MKTAYDPAAAFELKVSEVELRRAPGGRMLMARIYQPQGAAPFPTLLDRMAAPGTAKTVTKAIRSRYSSAARR
jgi:hypothetical protein